MDTKADPDQHARFVETARALGCDESEEAFDEKLRAVVGPKPPEQKPIKPPKKPIRAVD